MLLRSLFARSKGIVSLTSLNLPPPPQQKKSQFGYAFAYGDRATPNSFIGSQFFGMSQLPEGGAAGAPQYYQWIFQWSFAATACTIVSGAIAERTRFEAYFFYSFFMAAWVYPVIVHSVWSVNGWANMNRANGPLLFQRGAIDFAGSGAVHMVGGEGCF